VRDLCGQKRVWYCPDSAKTHSCPLRACDWRRDQRSRDDPLHPRRVDFLDLAPRARARAIM